MTNENIGDRGEGRVENLGAKVRHESETELSVSFLLYYLEWLSPELQSEVQQERKKQKNRGFVCNTA